jgi:glycerophosphoryl diester phosphodiesterase
LIVIAHRGASGYRPEHTLEAYRLAIRQGADFIEPDLVITRDGVLVARHENEISGTTDVAAHPEFADRRTTKTIDGHACTGWFVEDFTLVELKTLRARERIPEVRPDNTRFDGMYSIPTFAEVVQLAKSESRNGRVVGVYPETKHPTWFAKEGRYLDGSLIATSLGAKLVETLVAEGFTDPTRVYIQSFEVANLIELKQRLMPDAGVDLPLIQLFGDLERATPYDFTYNVRANADLVKIYGELLDHVEGGIAALTRFGALATESVLGWMRANYASGIGPQKSDVVPREVVKSGHTSAGASNEVPTRHGNGRHALLAHAIGAGLVVHPYTLRAEECFLERSPAGATQSVIDEAMQLFDLGVHGFFIDQPDQGVVARETFIAQSDLSLKR